MNDLRGLEPFRVYGILSDSITFEFFGYDGTKFYRDLPMALSNETIRGTPPDYYLDAMGKGKLLNKLLKILI
jgi:hypothetical protein